MEAKAGLEHLTDFPGKQVIDDVLEVGPGDERTVAAVAATSDTKTARLPFNAAGEIVLNVTFTDGTMGIFVAKMPVQSDEDEDGSPDLVDNCPATFNPDQSDLDGNRLGDACNDGEDRDGDDIADEFDNCPDAPDSTLADTDGDGVGDACNDADDSDGDEYHDALDNCPDLPNDQTESDGDGLGDACDPFPFEPDNEKGQLRDDLDVCQDSLLQCRDHRFFVDADGDGEEASTDACPDTPVAEAVDALGCSQSQFCARAVEGGGKAAWRLCLSADWLADESLARWPRDCKPAIERKGGFGFEIGCVAR